MKRHHLIAIITGICGVIFATRYRMDGIVPLILLSLVALSIFFKDKHPFHTVVSCRLIHLF